MENNSTQEKEYRMPMIGDPAPAFRAMTTNGKVNFPEDYKGQWVVLFSHPADFTPVCTTEFIAFSKQESEFEKLNTKLIGLSIDSLHSHLAWLKSVEKIEIDGVKIPIKFPVIADISMQVAKKYGMLQTVAKTQTIRAVFIIDPEGIVRAILYYPMSTGRNIEEIKRVIQSLQLHDTEHVSTPANWLPGDKVVLGAPLTQDEIKERMINPGNNCEVKDWYLTLKKM
ncbi:MAG: peroxiredoxin [Lachnospiraceae bacterium]|nr:peroxiredoxin [Lachnospiraceae bacterium]